VDPGVVRGSMFAMLQLVHSQSLVFLGEPGVEGLLATPLCPLFPFSLTTPPPSRLTWSLGGRRRAKQR
jgi:hypothetical protein